MKATISRLLHFVGINNKLMGQVYLTQIGKGYLRPGGSITLTTGILADDPVERTTSAAMVNGGIHSFVKAAVLELKNDIRLNVVTPGLLEDSYEKFHGYFPGYPAVKMSRMVLGYVRAVEGKVNGEVIRIFE